MRRYVRRRAALILIAVIALILVGVGIVSYNEWYVKRVAHLKILCESQGLHPLNYYYGQSLSFCENDQGAIFHLDEPEGTQ